MTTDGASIKVEMLQQAAQLAAGEEGEEAWYIVHLLLRTQPRELLRMCHFTLATFLELNYEYFDDGWPLQSRLDSPSAFTSAAASSSYSSSYISQRGCPRQDKVRRLPSRSRRTSMIGQMEPSAPLTPKSTSGRLAWLKGRSLLPSKLAVFTPTASPAPKTNTKQSISASPAASTKQVPSSSLSDSQFFSDADTTPKRFPYCHNPNYVLCRYISDFMLQSPDLLTAEGLFRRPGSLSRSKMLYSELKECLTGECVGSGRRILRSGVSQTSLSSTPFRTRSTIPQNRHSEHRKFVYDILSSALVYDVASVLLLCLSSTHAKSTTDSGLIPHKATDLFFKTTRLQYHLKDRHPVYALDPATDWMHLLCHSRQLLAYRIIVQFLLPIPERQLLLKLLSLLHKIASNSAETRMSSEALARCLAFAVFGIPDDAMAMSCCIDTLINLIELYEELETLPRAIYQQVRIFLKSKLGTSPMKNPMRVKANQAKVDPLSVDSSSLKRSWATCQISMDASCASLSLSTAGGKENRPYSFANLCLWLKSSPTKTSNSHAPSTPPPLRQTSASSLPTTATLGTPQVFLEMQRRHPRAPSPFLIWKKQRSTLSMK